MGFLKKYYDTVDKYHFRAGGLTLFDLFRPFYEAGSKDGYTEGKKQGYENASNEYEKKLLMQADAFLKQKKVFRNQKLDYEILLDEYERYIDTLMGKTNITEKEKKELNRLVIAERRLRMLSK